MDLCCPMFYIMLGKHDHVLSAKKNATKEGEALPMEGHEEGEN